MPARLPELLTPAGSPEKLETALTYGADAVYLGGPSLSLRSAGFAWEELSGAFARARARGARSYFCLNAFPRQAQLPQVREALARLADSPSRPDGLIVADPGVFRLARRLLPDLPLHVSTQANTGNAEAAGFWRDLGARRVNLARETDFRAVRDIRRAVPDLEIELFGHGAMCLALSGRCLLSDALLGRSANQGRCAHPCRYDYRVAAVGLEEATRPGQILWEIQEAGEHGALMSPQDLCLIKFIPWLARVGVAALKIEGRTKSSGYLALVADVWRTALDDLGQGRFRPAIYLAELARTGGRDLTSGFFLGDYRQARTYASAGQASARAMLARLVAWEGEDRWRAAVRSAWRPDLSVQIVAPGLRRPVLPPGSYALENDEGSRLPAVHSGQTVILRADHPDLRPGLFLRAASA